MQAAEPIHDAAGEGLLAGGDLQLQAMQPVAGRGWGVIPPSTKSTKSAKGLHHGDDGELPDIACFISRDH
jgi:hypothetical protein